MSINTALKRASRFIASNYNDELIIYKNEVIKNEDGSTDVIEGELSEEKYKCRISKTKLDNSLVEDINKYNVEYKIFCGLDVNIKEGDTIAVNKLIGDSIVDTIKGVAGKPYVYPMAQEIIIIQRGFA